MRIIAEYTALLLEIILTTDEALEERQMAAVVLKRYIKDHWTNDEYDEVVINDEAKHKIRLLLPMGLSDPQQKIRTAVAVALAHIAEHDYPDNWSNMAYVMKSKLLPTNPADVDGVVTFLDACSMLLEVEKVQSLYTELYNIFQSLLENEVVNM